MSNTWFQFKQFKIAQERCAMKVTTDACIQGAWTPLLPGTHRVLDIGTGTGLLALMLAQRQPGITIDAIELDANAAAQAKENCAASPWSDRLQVMQGDVKEYRAAGKYDLIITNPPFFNDSLLSGNASKDHARHTLALSYPELLAAISANLNDDGYVSVLLPYAAYGVWKDVALQEGYHEVGKLSISHRPGAIVKRVVGLFSKAGKDMEAQELVIQNEAGQYSQAFIQLLQPFYLDL